MQPLILNDIIKQNAFLKSNETAYIFLKQGEEVDRLTFEELYEQALYLAKKLQKENIAGSRIMLVFPPGLNFIVAFCACLMAKMIAIPCLPPRSQRETSRFLKIIKDSRCSSILLDANLAAQLKKTEGAEKIEPLIRLFERGDIKNRKDDITNLPEVDPNDLAMMQYTSGSTGDPKGVMLTHHNLIYNQACIKEAFGHHGLTIVVGWLPHYHDMGLIGNILQPLYLGRPAILMSPNDFVQKPILWLEAISKYKATTTGAPCFAYDLCVKKIPEIKSGELDLSTLEVAYIGSEVVVDNVLNEFDTRFKNTGFKQDAFLPCYGLAEATLLVSGSKGKRKIYSDERNLISNGKTYGVNVKIVDDKTCQELEDRKIGEIWINGPSVAKGYWNKDEMNKEIFGARLAGDAHSYLRTGDLGFISNGELYVSGRLKAMIKIRGLNYFSEDIELSLQNSVMSLKRFGGSAFAVQDNYVEKLIIVHEIEKIYIGQLNYTNLIEEMQETVVRNFGILPSDVVLVPEWSIPRTSSGKIIREICKEKYLANELKVMNAMAAA